MCADHPRLVSIPAGVPFLPTLADALLAGRLVPGWPDRADPLSLAAGTVLLPTRRSVRAFASILADRAAGEGGAVLLPRILPIGDVDEAEESLLLEGPGLDAVEALGGGVTDLPPEASEGVRRIALARLVLAWAAQVDRAMLRLDEGETLLVPAGPADALALAGDLGRLIDTLTIHGKTFEDLHGLVPEDFSRYWSISRDFLAIAAEHWPQMSREAGTMDAALRRHLLHTAEAGRLARERPAGPLVAAGSTGSMPATAALLRAIAGLPRGAVVLPGLDHHLDREAWRCVLAPSGEGHPQAMLGRLLQGFGLEPEGVGSLGEPTPALRARSAFLSEALRPAETTEAWLGRPTRLPDDALAEAVAGLDVVEAADDREEALAIAVVLRGQLENPGATAALVTPDRSLAERVCAELKRWDIVVDDSAGQPLARTGAGVLARLVADAAAAEFEAQALLALLAHPHARLGLPRATVLRGRSTLEIGVLRGPALAPGLAALRQALEAAWLAIPQDSRAARPKARLGAPDWQDALAVLDALDAAFAGFRREALGGRLDLLALAARHEVALAGVAQPAPDEAPHEPAGTAAEELAVVFEEAWAAAGAPVAGTLADYPAFFSGLLAGHVARRTGGAHRRLRIWGPLEARLLDADLVVLGGLDEKTWPGETRGDAFLNRPLREQLGLPALERRIGQTAHDFAQSLGAPRVVITRARKRGGDPTVPSRFLQRMGAVAGKALWDEMTARGDVWLAWARRLDRPARVRAISRPAPRPDARLQPVRLSVTEVETLVRDPYAVYARHVLGLDPLDDVALPPSAATRGTLIHDVVGRLAEAWPQALPDDLVGELLRLGREVFDAAPDLAGRPDVRAFWWPRFQRIVGYLAEWERRRRRGGTRVVAETGGRLALALADGTPFDLTARADRFEIRTGAGLAVIDFKTGALPGVKEVQVGFSPQLTLEAAMARAGAFRGVPPGLPTDELLYVHLSGGATAGAERLIKPPEAGQTLDDLADRHLAGLVTLLSDLRSGERAFLSRPAPKFAKRYAPYDHLARVREWSLVGTDDEGGGEA